MILVVDPGIRGCGAALYEPEGSLFACAYVKNPAKTGNDIDAVLSMARAVEGWMRSVFGGRTEHFVGEWPRIYTASKSKGDNNDLLPLVGVVCSVAAILGVPTTRYFPHEWKGQASKEATEARVADRLDGNEKQVLAAAMNAAGKSLAHNTVDAVAIGLFHVGRFSPKRVYPR